MARGRMISKTLGSSRRFSALAGIAGEKTEFCQALYPLIVAHADDFGRLEGDSFTISKRVFPVSRRSEAEFEDALRFLEEAKLIVWYGTPDAKTIEVINFSEHQQGLHKRTKSKFPDPEVQTRNKTPWSKSSQPLSESPVGRFFKQWKALHQKHLQAEYQFTDSQKNKDIEAIGILLNKYEFERLSEMAQVFFRIDKSANTLFKDGRRTPAMMLHLAPRISQDLTEAEQ
jgi:hypothetical protein